MPLFEFKSDKVEKVERTTLAAEGIYERSGLQRVLRDHIHVVAPGCMVLDEEFGGWEESRRRIDLLCLDESANLVVVELKRTEDGGHMELQALRYAAMVSTMTFEQAAAAHGNYLRRRGLEGDPQHALLDFLRWESPDDNEFASDVRIILVAADFGKELTTCVMWLLKRDVDVRCVQLNPHKIDETLVLDVQQVLPLPEAEEYTVRVREKERRERRAREGSRDHTKFDVTIDGELQPRLSKRKTMFQLVRGLCSKGVSPEEVAEAIPWARKRLWLVVEGVVNAEDFLAKAGTKARAENRSFDPQRWFCDDGDLFEFDGRTYALTNQWGVRASQAIQNLLERFPNKGIDCSESD